MPRQTVTRVIPAHFDVRTRTLVPERTEEVVHELDQAPRVVWDGPPLNVVKDQPRIGMPTVPAADTERIERWMNWKRAAKLRTSLSEQLEKATARGSRGTNIKLEDLAVLLALVEPGEEPK